jgi:hypothetical protein
MFFNFNTVLPRAAAPQQRPRSILFPNATGAQQTEITVLKSLDHPVNKRFSLDENGEVTKIGFQQAFSYDVHTTTIGGIEDLARLIEHCSTDNSYIFIRGLPTGKRVSVQRLGSNFPEHPEGTPWVMLDFDDIALPDGLNPLSREAIEYVVAKLPLEFQTVSYFYQHSASAGILRGDGTPLKSGLNVHLFFCLDRRVPGKMLSAYLMKHCVDSDFYQIGENGGGIVALTPGVDPAPIRTSVQPHFVAAPTIDAGVRCSLDPAARQGLVRKERADVKLPEIEPDIERLAWRLQNSVREKYKRQHGYTTRSMSTSVSGSVAVTRYSVAPSQEGRPVRTGRTFRDGSLSADGKFLKLSFDDEGSPGSWYVRKDRPQLGYRHGDGNWLPLRELSLGAHEYVRDHLGWFSEVPHRDIPLRGRYVPPLRDFAMAKASLVLAPTGTGKTKAVAVWARECAVLRQLVLYAAPTIALVNQALEDLRSEGLIATRYDQAYGTSMPQHGVIVTTYESLPKFLDRVHREGTPHVLVLDEIHDGLDHFMTNDTGLRLFETGLVKSRHTLLLTGTLTDVQRHAMASTARNALGSLTEGDYCCYEFPSVKRNPFHVLPLARFASDFVTLLKNFSEKLRRGEPIPRFIMVVGTSKMERYRILLEKHGLTDQAIVVSRQENTAEEIEAARTSDKPILIASPLFSRGINFVHEPAVLWARFDGISADTNSIIQTVNRANRGQVPCEVRIYGNIHRDAEFPLPAPSKIRAEIAERLSGETSFVGLLESHFHLDRLTYRSLRDAERDSSVSLSVLVRDDAIQNYRIVALDDLPAIDKGKKETAKQAHAEARSAYDEAVREQAERFSGFGPEQALWKLEWLGVERRDNWKSDHPRLEIEFRNERAGLFMAAFRIDDPVAAQKVNLEKVLRLFGEKSPWTSSQYDRERHPQWAKVEAEKTDKLVVLLEKLEALRAGEISADGMAEGLTRNRRLGDAFKALAGNELEFQSVCQKLEALRQKREIARKGGATARKKVQGEALALLREFLEPLGVRYGKVTKRGREVTDNTKPIVPSTWDLPWMILRLRRQAARLAALPVGQKVPVLPAPEVEEEPFLKRPPMPRGVCEPCTFFLDSSCCIGRSVDWQDFEKPDPRLRCDVFKHVKAELMLQ